MNGHRPPPSWLADLRALVARRPELAGIGLADAIEVTA